MNFSFRFLRHCCFVAAVSAFALLGMPLASHGAIITYRTTMSGAAEAVPNGSLGTGTAQVVYDNVAHTMLLNVNFSGLGSNATLAHIHIETPTPLLTSNGPVATAAFASFPFGGTSGNYAPAAPIDLTQATSFTTGFNEARLAASLAAGTAYFNIHTAGIGSGEIRGFLVAVPEPSSIFLSGLAVIGGVAIRYRRKLKFAEA